MTEFKRRLAQTDARMTMHICTIPSATVTQTLAANGADSVFIDLEHGAIDYEALHAMIAATAGTDCAPLVRITENTPAHVKRALDLGAAGIVFPMVRTADDARAAVAAMLYPPNGVRGFGPFHAAARWQVGLLDYRDQVEPQLTTVLLVETAASVDNIDEICAVPGIDLLVPAPFDLSTELGIPGQFDHPDFIAAVQKIEAAALAAKVPLGGIAFDQPQADALFARGYRVVAAVDILWLGAMTRAAQGWL